jgi:hypothetical protein
VALDQAVVDLHHFDQVGRGVASVRDEVSTMDAGGGAARQSMA